MLTWFQFHKVRLKAAGPGFRSLSRSSVSIPQGTIKRTLRQIRRPTVLSFQFHKVRLKAVITEKDMEEII